MIKDTYHWSLVIICRSHIGVLRPFVGQIYRQISFRVYVEMVSKMCRKVNDRYPTIFCRCRSPTGTVLRRGYVEPDTEFRNNRLTKTRTQLPNNKNQQQHNPTTQQHNNPTTNQQQHDTTINNNRHNNNNNQHNNETTTTTDTTT